MAAQCRADHHGVELGDKTAARNRDCARAMLLDAGEDLSDFDGAEGDTRRRVGWRLADLEVAG